MIGNRNINPPSGYKIVCSNVTRNDGHERGTAILVHRRISFEKLQLHTNLQAVAIKINLSKTYTICSLYLPHVQLHKPDVVHLLGQLPAPFLILGDMNAKSIVWGSEATDQRGRIFEELLLEHGISLLNDNSPTHYHIQTNTYSTIDLSICSSDSLLDFNYSVSDSLHCSDHYPIFLQMNNPTIIADTPDRYNTSKADWQVFRTLTNTSTDADDFPCIDDLITHITLSIIEAADAAIPIKSGIRGRPPITWFTDECRDIRRQTLRAERAIKRKFSIVNKIAYNRAKARNIYVIKQSRKESWHSFVGSINSKTSLHSAWKKAAKISGKFSPSPTPVLKLSTGETVRAHDDVASLFAESLASVTGDHNYSNEFLRYKARAERKHSHSTHAEQTTCNIMNP
jgi:hypothetical protein